MRPHKTSISESLLNFILHTEISYKGVRVNLLGLPIMKKHKPQSVYNALNILRKKSLITKSEGKVTLTQKGIKYLQKRKNVHFNSSVNQKNLPKNLLVIFDIPESHRAYRNWFRSQLKFLNFEMVQQSVWLGPGPLPKEIKNYLKEINLNIYIKYFIVKK